MALSPSASGHLHGWCLAWRCSTADAGLAACAASVWLTAPCLLERCTICKQDACMQPTWCSCGCGLPRLVQGLLAGFISGVFGR